mgnify:CR=1 FL=1
MARLTNTRGQLKTMAFIEKLGFFVTLEERRGPYWIDCFVQELGIAVEYDGPSHGLSKKRDAKRDLELVNTYGILRVVRVTDTDFKDHIALEKKILGEE